MPKRFKRFLSALLVLAMCLSFVPTAVFAAPGDVARNVDTGTEYATLEEAISAANAGETIELLSDVSVDVTGMAKNSIAVSVDKDITIEGNGYTIKAAGTAADCTLVGAVGGAIVKLANVTVDGSGLTKHGVQAYSNGAQTNLTLENVRIQNNRWYGLVINASAVTAAGLVTSGNAWGVNVDSKAGPASFEMNSGSINEAASVVIESDPGCGTETTINGGSLKNVGVHTDAGAAEGVDVININGGTVASLSGPADEINVAGGEAKDNGDGTYAIAYNVTFNGVLFGSFVPGEEVNVPAPVASGDKYVSHDVKAGGTTITNSYTDGVIAFTMPAAPVEVTFVTEATVAQYTVEFTAGGLIVATGKYNDGDTLTVPAVPEKAGYTGQWDPAVESTVSADAVYTAVYTPNTYTVTNTVTGEADNAVYGEAFMVPAAPADVPEDSTFTAWSGSDGKTYLAGETYTYTVAGDLTLTPVYDKDSNTEYWTVKFLDKDGSLYDVMLVKTAADPVAVYMPAYAPNPSAKWTVDGLIDYAPGAACDVSGDAVFQVVIVPVQSQVTWQMVDTNGSTVTPDTALVTPVTGTEGETIQVSFEVPEGYELVDVTATAGVKGVSVTRADSAAPRYTYTFTMPGEAVNVKIQVRTVEPEIPAYTVTFLNDDGSTYRVVSVKEGDPIEAPQPDPAKAGHNFLHWTDGVNVLVSGAVATGDVTYTAVYEKQGPFTVTYDDGTVGGSNYMYGDTFIAAPPQDPDNFICWQASDGRIVKPGLEYTVTGNLELTAVRQADKPIYTVSFMGPDGHVFITLLATAENGYDVTVPALPVVDGYDVLGWNYGSAIVAEGYLMQDVDMDLVLYLNLAPMSYTVTVVEDPAGLNAATAVGSAAVGSVVEVSVNVPDGYLFKGITALSGVVGVPVTDAGNGKYTFVMPAGDVTVTASFEKIPAGKAYVKFVYGQDGEVYDSAIVTKGESVTAPAQAPVQDGKVFTGWKRGSAVLLPGQDYLISETDDDTIVFVAQWTDSTYTVSFDPDGGTPTPPVVSDVLYGTEMTLADAPAKEGYAFIGWMDDATGFVYKAGASYTVTGNASFTAQWSTNAYVVRFVDESGLIYGYDTVDYGETVIAPAAPTAEGKTFQYWENGTVQVNAGAETPAVTGDVTYTAVWQTNTHSVTSVASNAEVSPASLSGVEVGTEVSFTVAPAADYAVAQVYTTHKQGAATITTVLTADDFGNYSFTMPDSDVVIHVVTVQNVFSVFQNTDDAPHLTITTPSVKAEAGTDVVFTVSSSHEDYALNNVYVTTLSGLYVPVEMKLVMGEPEYHFTMPAEDVMIYAQEIRNVYTVTYVDADNTLLKIETVASGEEAPYFEPDAPEGYTFAGWDNMATVDTETMPGGGQMPSVRENLYLKAVYQAQTYKVKGGLVQNLERFGATTYENMEGNLVDLLNGGTLSAETGSQVQFAVMAEYDWSITGVAVVTASGKAVQPALVLLDTKQDADGNGCEYRVYAFTMPAEDVRIDVYTAPKDFKVTVTENIPEGGTYDINGYVTDNLMVAQGEEARVTVVPADGYTVKSITATYVLPNGTVANVTDLDPDVNSFAFDMVSYDVTVAIEYEANIYGIDVKTSNGSTFYPGISSTNVDEAIETLTEDNQGYVTLVGGKFAYDDVNGVLHNNPQNGEAAVGTEVAFQVKTFRGFALKGVTVTYADGTKSCVVTQKGGTYHFTMPADDVVITAVFEKAEYTVNKVVSGEDHGDILMNGKVENEITAAYKDEVTVEVTPDAGYYVKSISYEILDPEATDFNDAAKYENTAAMVDVLDGTQSLTFHVPSSDVTVTVEYAEIDYTISTDVQGEGTLTVQDKANVGDQVSVTATPDYGYKLVSIQVTDADGKQVSLFTRNTEAETGSEYFFTMPASAVTVSAVFEKVEYVVTYVNYNNAVVGMEGVDYLDTADVASFVDNVVDGPVGQHFVGWTSADTQTAVTAPSVTNDDFVIVKDTTIKANFAKDEIDVVFAATENGTVTSEGNDAAWTDESKVFGDTVTFTVTPDVGYVIDTITVYTLADKDGDYKEIKWFEASGQYSFRIPATWKDSVHEAQAEDVNVSVTFKKAAYTLTKDAGCETEGIISVNGKVATETSYTYEYQDEVTISAAPNAGWYVKEIRAEADDGTVFTTGVKDAPAMDTLVGATETLTFRMPASNVTYTVDYEKIDYSITKVFDSAKGDVVTEPADKAQLDDVVKITVTPKLGYALDSLTVTYADGKKSCALTGVGENEFTFTMPAEAVTVTALFTEVTYNVTLTQKGEGESWMNGYYTVSMNADYLDTVTVTAKPAEGWKLTGIVVDGGKVSVNEAIQAEGGDYTFTMPNRDVTVEVIMEKIDYTLQTHTINFYEDGHGKASVSAESATVGDRIEIAADPDDGYRVKKVVVVDAKGNSIPVSFVSEDKDYTEIWSFTMPAEDVEITVKFEVQGSSYYTDVRTDAWYYNAVTFVTDRGYFRGVTDTLFAPYMNMNREMFVTVIGRIAGVDADAYAGRTSKFTDVKAGSWYAPYIVWAEETGVVKGITATEFGVGKDITREQMFTMLYRYAQYCGIDVTPENQQFLNRYTDRDKISAYAVDALNWCVGVGIARGMTSTTINPKDVATRAQAAQMFMNFCDKVLFQ